MSERLAQNFIIAHFSLAIGFNILVTAAIVARLQFMRRKIRGALTSSPYFSISTMIIESSALYSTFGTAFLISMATQSPALNVISPIMGQVAVRSRPPAV